MEISAVTVISLGVTVVYALASYGFSLRFGKRASSVDRWILAWLFFDAIIHFTMEGPFVVLSLIGTVNESDHFTAQLWHEYGKADRRWLFSDPTIVSLEIVTVALAGPLAILLAYAIIKGKSFRHFVQIVLCVCEIYGGWMTFCPDWLQGSPNLVTDNIMYLWVYLVFFNGLWVVIPFAMLYQSWIDMHNAFPEKRVPPTIKHVKSIKSKRR